MVPNNPLLPKAKTERKITEMCGVFGRSKQAYYKQLHHKADTTVKEETIVGLIKKKREIWKRGSGRNLHQCLLPELKQHGIKIGRDKFFDVLRNNHLLIKSKRCRTKPLAVIIILTVIKM
ncbi:MAG: hypothetical protein IPH58_07560 [Sphingobacteriales bacterium]|nr:hypothetical protein [Sphingobacteriales bacterium]